MVGFRRILNYLWIFRGNAVFVGFLILFWLQRLYYLSRLGTRIRVLWVETVMDLWNARCPYTGIAKIVRITQTASFAVIKNAFADTSNGARTLALYGLFVVQLIDAATIWFPLLAIVAHDWN